MENYENLTRPPTTERVSSSELEEMHKENLLTLQDSYEDPTSLLNTTTLNTQINQINNVSNESIEQPIMVETGRGIVVSNEQEILTEKMYGCTSVFIKGPQKALIHLTPNGSLPYKNYKFPDGHVDKNAKDSAEAISEAISNNPENLNDYSVFIVGNSGNNDKFSQYNSEVLHEDWSNLSKYFTDLGFSTVKIIELPLDETLIYHNPQSPDILYAVGHPTQINKEGVLEINKDQLDNKMIQLL